MFTTSLRRVWFACRVMTLVAGVAFAGGSASVAHAAGPADAALQGPQLQDGWYVSPSACPFEGCTLEWMWRVVDRTPFFAADKSIKEAGSLATGQVLQPLQAYVRVRPVRGVVQKADGTLRRGEVIWLLEPEGEGFFKVWRQGGLISWEVPEDRAAVRWDQPLDGARRMEWWVQLKPATGAPVWLRNPRGLECMDTLAGDTGCKPVPGKAGR